jgi:tRNA G18 (ribose-2'-O)-methylase SpoU
LAYAFWQCRDAGCRLRFPAPADEAALRCPRCRGPVDLTVAALDKLAVASIAPGGTSLVGLLDNIRSIHNAGSMFRSADGAGLAHLHLAGITATPDHPRLAKAALGAHLTVGWTYHANGVDAAEKLRANGYRLWALERLTAADRPALDTLDAANGPIALVVGNELAGVDPGILAQCDAVFSLPMAGHKSSLNAAVAFGIAVYMLRFTRYTALSRWHDR